MVQFTPNPKADMQGFRDPKEKILLGKIACNGNNSKKLHYISWELVCVDKCKSGLNLLRMKLRNEALLLKFWWKFLNERGRKWLKFVKNKYGADFIYGDLNKHPLSLIFRDIWNRRNDPKAKLSNESFKWKVGDGSSVRFWKDWWYGNVTLRVKFPRLFGLAYAKNISFNLMKEY